MGVKRPVLDFIFCDALMAIQTIIGWGFEGEDIDGVDDEALKKRFSYKNKTRMVNLRSIGYEIQVLGVVCLAEGSTQAEFNRLCCKWQAKLHLKQFQKRAMVEMGLVKPLGSFSTANAPTANF